MTSPLSPFLNILQAHGFRLGVSDYERIAMVLNTRADWTLNRLRDVLQVLLVKDEQQQLVFERVFKEFFQVQDDTLCQDIRPINVHAVLAEIQGISLETETIPLKIKRFFQPPVTHKNEVLVKKDRARWIVYSLLLCTIMVIANLNYYWQKPVSYANSAVPVAIKDTTITSTYEYSLPSATPEIKAVKHIPLENSENRQQAILETVLLWLLSLLYGSMIWQSRKVPKDPAADYLLKLPQHLSLEKLGGKPCPRLSQQDLVHIADSVAYFLSENTSRVLNITASINATSDQGGIPALKFFRQKQLRQIVILQDELSEALEWNNIASELHQGLQALGVSVLAARFRGSLREFIDDEGRKYYLEDLDSQRQGLIMLIFTDGKAIQAGRDFYSLELLSHWDYCAWMELRARAFWDESTALPVSYGIPLYAANAEGLLAAFAGFLTESAALHKQSGSYQGAQIQGRKDLGLFLELYLGAALPLAQACSMIQAVSFGLVDKVRLEFFPGLPADSIELLIKIPQTTRTVTGLSFSTAVLAQLRKGFSSRLTGELQEKILRFLLLQLKPIEPEHKKSLAWLQWSWRYHRLLLELEPEKALKQLSALSQTPLKNAIRQELGQCALPEFTEAGQIPLRKTITDKDARQRLGQLARHCGIKTLEAYPIALSKKALFVSLLLYCSMLSIQLLNMKVRPELVSIQFAGSLSSDIRLEEQLDNSWQNIKPASFVAGRQWRVEAGKTYRLLVAGKMTDLGKVNDDLLIDINGKPEKKQITLFQDCPECPKMVHIKGGSFMMGSPETEAGRYTNEKQHSVMVNDFYLGQTEVTVGQFKAFVIATNYQTDAEKGDGCYGWIGTSWEKDKKFNWRNVGFSQTAQQPVVCVSWNDAFAFVAWLNKVSGKNYGLPTEAQWEYAARGGTTTPFYTGECISTDQANYNGTIDYNNCGTTGIYKKQTLAVGSYPPNPWGLLDMAGNAWEWTCSEYDDKYAGKENQCISNNDANTLQVVRGGSWGGNPVSLRAARRGGYNPGSRSGNIGFRLSRM